MNKQFEMVEGQKLNTKIEWADYTWNPFKGCKHQCRWVMPDGSVAICYAESVAHGVAQQAYPDGFAVPRFDPSVLQEPLKLKQPSKIFLDSMSDVMGHWNTDEQIEQVLDVCRQAHWHTFQLLTKNGPRLPKFTYPDNVWVGASCPPTFMNVGELKPHQQINMLTNALNALKNTKARVRWMSFEPLSFDMATFVNDHAPDLEWAVIGAASRGKNYYQPDIAWVRSLLEVLDRQRTKVFYKGNLRALAEQYGLRWREDYPVIKPIEAGQLKLAL